MSYIFEKILLSLFSFIIMVSSSSAFACTGFTMSKDDKILVGNNEDWFDPDPYINVYPSEDEKYGRIFFEFPWPPHSPTFLIPFGGINDKGLVFDRFLHPTLKPIKSWYKPKYPGDLVEYAMDICETVKEVIDLFDKYNLYFMKDFQLFIVDRTGNSAIIEGDEIIYKGGDFQVVTNFLQSRPEHGWYPCWRYDTVLNILENIDELSIEYFSNICNIVHQEEEYPTIFSNIYDLNNNIIYLYHHYNYEKVISINITEEFRKGRNTYYLPSLFEPDNNTKPEKPSKPIGITSGRIKTEYLYRSKSTDPDGDHLYFLFDWGDNTNSSWIRSNQLGECTATHVWDNTGIYEVRVKVKDIYGFESNWSDPLSVNMPKNRDSSNIYLLKLFDLLIDRFPVLNFFMKILEMNL